MKKEKVLEFIYTKYQDQPIHIVAAADFENKFITIVTAYYPSPEKWDKTFKKRKL